jgi:hypothetical protein
MSHMCTPSCPSSLLTPFTANIMCKRLKINAGILHITKHQKDAQIKLTVKNDDCTVTLLN